MIAILIAATIIAAPATPQQRLAEYITKRQPKAEPYAQRLARAIVREARRVRLEPAALAAVAWVESRFDRRARGSAHEYGLWQLIRSDYRMAASWARLRPKGVPWRRLSRAAVIGALRDVDVSAYLAADELAGVRAWCRRAGHRISARWIAPRWVLGIDGVHRMHGGRRAHAQEIDRLAHHQSGPRWPLRGYTRALRAEYRRIQQVIRGR